MKSLLDYFDAVKIGLTTSVAEKGVQIPLIDFAEEVDDWNELADIAILIDFPGLDESKENDSAGRNNENVTVYLHCILSNRLERAGLRVINLASFIKRLIVRQKWELSGLNNPENIVAYPSDFQRGEKGFKCWTVEFSQVIKMDEALTEEEFPVNEVFFGVNPESDSDYKLIGSLDE